MGGDNNFNVIDDVFNIFWVVYDCSYFGYF